MDFYPFLMPAIHWCICSKRLDPIEEYQRRVPLDWSSVLERWNMHSNTSAVNVSGLEKFLNQLKLTNRERAVECIDTATSSPPVLHLTVECGHNLADEECSRCTVTTYEMIINVNSSRFSSNTERCFPIPIVTGVTPRQLKDALPLVASLLSGLVPEVQPCHLPAIFHSCSFLGAEMLLEGAPSGPHVLLQSKWFLKVN